MLRALPESANGPNMKTRALRQFREVIAKRAVMKTFISSPSVERAPLRTRKRRKRHKLWTSSKSKAIHSNTKPFRSFWKDFATFDNPGVDFNN
jgi:hypothetical protein